MSASLEGNHGIKIVRSRTISKSSVFLYQFWRNPKNLEKIIDDPIEITAISPTESHWKVCAPFGRSPIEWDSVITHDEVNHVIAWRSRHGAEVANAGSVHFHAVAGGSRTEVCVELEYDPPGGRFAAWVAKLSYREPGRQVTHALRRLNNLMEHVEIEPVENPPVGLDAAAEVAAQKS